MDPTARERSVHALLATTDRFLTVAELHTLLPEQIPMASLYRYLESLTRRGLLDRATSPAGCLRYRACTTGVRHHHLICARCGVTIELTAPAVDAWLARVAAGAGYRDVGVSLSLHGTCARCTT